MRSRATPRFWAADRDLPTEIKEAARRPSGCSVRMQALGRRALGQISWPPRCAPYYRHPGLSFLALKIFDDPLQIIPERFGVSLPPAADLLDDLVIERVRHSKPAAAARRPETCRQEAAFSNTRSRGLGTSMAKNRVAA